jgi:cytidylate kinase
MAVITISSTFGSGGSVIGTNVGSALGWKVINRAIPVEVADQLDVPIDVVLDNDEWVESRFRRALTHSAILLAAEAGESLSKEVFGGGNAFLTATERVIKRLVDASDCVIVGRAGAVLLGKRSDALHVRFDGPQEARLRQAMDALNLTDRDARQKLQQTDRARAEYVRHFYKRDWADPSLYHMTIDSTALPISVCVELVLTAAAGLRLQRITGTS